MIYLCGLLESIRTIIGAICLIYAISLAIGYQIKNIQKEQLKKKIVLLLLGMVVWTIIPTGLVMHYYGSQCEEALQAERNRAIQQKNEAQNEMDRLLKEAIGE